MEYTFTLDELPDVVENVLDQVTNKTLLFYGEMGVGKTTLIKEIAKKLGVDEEMSSPTYSIVNEYVFDNDSLYHFDFFRIENKEEAFDIGIEEYFLTRKWILVEWPEKIEQLLPVDNTKIRMTKNKNGSRTINILLVN